MPVAAVGVDAEDAVESSGAREAVAAHAVRLALDALEQLPARVEREDVDAAAVVLAEVKEVGCGTAAAGAERERQNE